MKKESFFVKIIDRTSFSQIFLLWLILIITFGMIYHLITLLDSSNNYLNAKEGNKITGFMDKIYFSFVSATTTGYGDITPKGLGMRSLAVTNVIVGIIMMAIVTSKIVSIKQQNLLNQIYKLNSSEKINRLITALSVFHSEANECIKHITDTLNRKQLFAIKLLTSSLKYTLSELNKEILHNDDKIVAELIISRIQQSFDCLGELTRILQHKDMHFKNPAVLEDIYLSSNIADSLLTYINKKYPIYSNKISEINAINKKIKNTIMGFRVIDKTNNIEINITPEILS